MFILFGWGHETRDNLGPTVQVKCPNCNNRTFWHLLNIKLWFTFFFIRLFPYESKHLLLCDVCSHGLELKGPQIEKAKRLNAATIAYLNKQITEEKYRENLQQYVVIGPTGEIQPNNK